MPVARLVLVETSSAGNLGAALRVAANFGVPGVSLVRPRVDPADPEVASWACGAAEHLTLRVHPTLEDAVRGLRTTIATASARGRDALPLVTPDEAAATVAERGLDTAALVFGNETSGLSRDDLDRCDLIARIPTRPAFPVLNLTQAIAILLGYLAISGGDEPPSAPEPAPEAQVDGLMHHARSVLTGIGFLDPRNPQRILRKLRRVAGRAGVTENEVAILRGILRQVEWAARTAPLADPDHRGRYDRDR